MRVIKKKVLDEAMKKYADARSGIRAWLAEAEFAQWSRPNDVKSRYPAASFVGDQVIFNIGGNKYRLVVHIAYRMQVVSISWFGPHDEYSRKKF